MTFKDALDNYLNEVVSNEASDIQYLETKKAFVAGAYATRNLIFKASDNENLEVAETSLLRLHEDTEKEVRGLLA
jgi:hypothetical protein